MSMNFPANPVVGDVHALTDDMGRTTNFQWDGICWCRTDDPSPAAAVRPGPRGPRERGDDGQPKP
jgi:hypothetical protein